MGSLPMIDQRGLYTATDLPAGVTQRSLPSKIVTCSSASSSQCHRLHVRSFSLYKIPLGFIFITYIYIYSCGCRPSLEPS